MKRKDETDEEMPVGVLITLLGAEGLKIYKTFTFEHVLTPGDANQIRPISLHSISNPVKVSATKDSSF